MRKRKIRTNYDLLKDSDAETILSDGLVHTENNPKLPIPAALFADFKAKLAAYIKSLRDIPTGGSIAVAKKNKDKKAVCKAVSLVTQVINIVADGDAQILLSSGFPLNAEKTKHQLTAPAGLTAIRTDVDDQIILKVPVVKEFKARSVVFAVSPAKDAPTDINDWKHYFTSAHTIVLDDVPNGVPHVFSASYIGSGAAKYNWCNIITRK